MALTMNQLWVVHSGGAGNFDPAADLVFGLFYPDFGRIVVFVAAVELLYLLPPKSGYHAS